MRHFIFLVVLSFLASFAAQADAAEFTKSAPPNTRDLLRVLFHAESTKLDVKDESKGCKSVEGTPRASYDLGDYLSFLTSSLDAKNGNSGVTSLCKKTSAGFACEVNFSTGLGTESPWTYGLRFQLDSTGKKLTGPMTCSGTG